MEKTNPGSSFCETQKKSIESFKVWIKKIPLETELIAETQDSNDKPVESMEEEN